MNFSRYKLVWKDLLIIALITISAVASVIIVLNPQRMAAEHRNSWRREQVISLIAAVTNYRSKNPAELKIPTQQAVKICPQNAECKNSISMAKALAEIPQDPIAPSNESGFAIQQVNGDRIQIEAVYAELGTTILAVKSLSDSH